MKTYLTIFIIFLLSFKLSGQRERNYIYLFDCTKSMEGFNKSPNIWNSTKKYLKEDIERLTSNHVYINIVPFQGKTYKAIQFDSKDYNWINIENQLNEYIRNISKTNICDAWDDGLKFIDPNKDNYIFILTDGNDNVKGVNELCIRMSKWCGQFKNSYAFYVMLTKEANDIRIINTLKNCETIKLIQANGEHVTPIGRIEPSKITVNTNELNNKFKLSISTFGNFSAKVHNSDSLFELKIINNSFINGTAEVQLTSKKNSQQIIQALNGVKSYIFNIKIEGTNIDIVNPYIEVEVINVPEKTLILSHKNEVDIGKVEYYPEFLFIKEKKQELLTFDIKPVFNKIAHQAGSSVRFKVSNVLGVNDYDVFFNGQLCKNDEFELTTNTKPSLLGIRFQNNSSESKRYFKLTEISNNSLDRINDDIPNKFELTIRAIYEVNWNPLKTILMWILIICILLLILWFSILRSIFYPKFKIGKFVILEPYYKNIKLKGEARKIILSNQNHKQGILNKIFCGSYICETNSFWTKEWIIEPKNKNSIRPISNINYLCTPYSISLIKNSDYAITNIETNETSKIQIY